MEIDNYLHKLQSMYNVLLELFEAENDKNMKYQELINFVDIQKIQYNRNDFKLFFYILLEISCNHHRQNDFFNYISKIINFFKEFIRKLCSNYEILDIFKRNKRVLLFVIESKILIFDEYLTNELKSSKYSNYFFPEIKNFLNEKEIETISSKLPNNFIENRILGENDSYISSLIRTDSVQEFISYVNHNKLSLSRTTIKRSIFETNSFLIDKEPTLIEYSAFFGSIQIFQYLKNNKVKLTPSLWIYAIHGKNPELIHILEENQVKPDDETFKNLYEESIKCHHNDFAKYIENNYLQNNENQYFSFLPFYIKYYNFELIQNNFSDKSIICDLCYFNYITLVELLLKYGDVDVNARSNNIQNKANDLNNVQIYIFNYILYKIIFLMKFQKLKIFK